MQLISKKEAARLTGYHPESIMRLSRAGHFPKPVKIGGRPGSEVRFIQHEVDDWIEASRVEAGR